MPQPTLIFDLDGTLIDPREGITRCLTYALETIGADIPSNAALELCIGPPLREALASILGGPDQVERAVGLYRERYAASGVFENELYPGILEMLAGLRRGSRAMYIATTKPRVHAETIARLFGFEPLFDGVHGSELSGERADKTELLAYMIENGLLGDGPVAMIGDRKYDMAAARAHGMFAVGVTWGFGSAEELREAGADVLCESIEALPGVLQELRITAAR